MGRNHQDQPPNTQLRAARERLPSPSGSGRPMSRQELAQAVNAYLWEKYHREENLDENDIGKLESGKHRWPGERRREAFLTVLGGKEEAELGFYIIRRTRPPSIDHVAVGAHGNGRCTERHTDERVGCPRSETHLHGLPEGPEDDGDAMRRRDLLAIAGTSLVTDACAMPSRTVQALNVVASPNSDDLDADIDTIGDLVCQFSHTVNTLSPTKAYDELLSVRSYVGRHLEHVERTARRRADYVMAAGNLSNLLAVVSSYLNDHTAALVWCCDAERLSQQVAHPDLAGWSILTRAMISYYQGQAERSAILARRGQCITQLGTVANAKLAAQEMRARAMLGDADGMAIAKTRAGHAIAMLPPDTATTGPFSIPVDEDPPYTATSLVLVGRYQEAIAATNHVIETVYQPDVRGWQGQPSNYGRSLLILGLAHAGCGQVAEASTAGRAALATGWLVWPTRVLAGKLDRVLTHSYADVAEAADYHACYLDNTTTT